METVIRHDLPTGTTTVYRDDEWLDGLAADWELAAVSEGLHSEPEHGDFHRHAGAVFGDIARAAANDWDAPGWAKEAI